MDNKDQLFASVLHLFFNSGMQGFGKMPNPLDQHLSVDLEQAEESIQILEVFKEKTQGNLSEELSSVLQQYLHALKELKTEALQP